MKIYKGLRGPQGTIVTVDDVPLDPRTDLRNFNADGFEWGYEGSGPSQLALALIADHLNAEMALKHYRDFMTTIIAEIEGDEWTMSSEDIDRRTEEITIVPMDLETLLRKVRGED